MNNLGFTGSYDPKQIYAGAQMGGGAPQAYLGGFDPAGVYGDPAAAAPYASGYGTFGGDEDPMAIMPGAGMAGPKFAQAPKKKAKWRGKAKAGLEGFADATAASAKPIEHYRFSSGSGLLGR